MEQSIDVFIDRKVVILREDDEILNAAKAMSENQLGCIVVYDDESKISGILTDRDIVCNSISLDLDPNTPIKMIMESDVVWLNEDATVGQAISLMKRQGIRRLPIVEELRRGHHRCVGIVTLDDLIAGEYISNKDLSDIIKSQILRRKKILHKSNHGDSKIDQTYNKFISYISNELSLEKNNTENIVKFILGSIIRRLHYTGGMHFVSQLPRRFQDDLLDLPAGPDRIITDKSVIQGISVRTGKSLTSSRVIALKFWGALRKLLGPGETDHVIHQLPSAMKELFLEPSDAEPEMAANIVKTEAEAGRAYDL